jgi:hypothetical protein
MKYEKICISYWAWCALVWKVWGFYFLWIFVIKYSKIWFIGILYKAIKYKNEFGQAYCRYLLKSIPKNFTLYFCEIYKIFYEF